MKPILLCVLLFSLSSYAVGQTHNITFYKAPADSNEWIFLDGKHHLLSLESLTAYWREYEDSCFADSSAVYADSGGVYHTCLVLNCRQVWDVPPTKVLRGYRHRTPDFPGFMAFLDRRRVRR